MSYIILYPPSKLSNTKKFPRQIVFPPLGRKWLYLHICIEFSQIARALQRYQIMYLILTRALQNQWSVIYIVFPRVGRGNLVPTRLLLLMITNLEKD